MYDVNVVYLNMEHGIHEQLTQNHDGSYTVFLNSRDSREVNMRWYKHAIEHIINDDYEKYDVQEIEHNSHNL